MTRPCLTPDYAVLLKEIKDRVAQAQTRAVLSVNAELVRLYWDIGRLIESQQQAEGWGGLVIPRLARELHNELPELKGFSERNFGRMIALYREYPDAGEILPQAAAKLPAPAKSSRATAKKREIEKVPQPAAQFPDAFLWSIPWFHHVILFEKVKDQSVRLWYIQQTLAHGLSRNVLRLTINSEALAGRGRPSRISTGCSTFHNRTWSRK